VKEGKLAAAAEADQRHLNAKAFIVDIPAKMENDQPDAVRKLAEAHAL
jgi:hypothetical protein